MPVLEKQEAGTGSVENHEKARFYKLFPSFAKGYGRANVGGVFRILSWLPDGGIYL